MSKYLGFFKDEKGALNVVGFENLVDLYHWWLFCPSQEKYMLKNLTVTVDVKEVPDAG